MTIKRVGKMLWNQSRVVLIPVIIAITPAVHADNVAPTAPQVPDFDAVDTNRDGTLSRLEAQAVPSLIEQFVLIDINADGRLGRDEYEVLRPSHHGS
jgi:hypothetical protein